MSEEPSAPSTGSLRALPVCRPLSPQPLTCPGNASSPASQAASIRNFSSGTSTSSRRTASCAARSRAGCASLTGSDELAEIGKRLGREALEEVASIVKPETILARHRWLIARKFDGSRKHRTPGRPRIAPAVLEWILRFARENRTWGYDRIAGALSNLGHDVSDQTVGNVLERHGIQPAPERKRSTTWKEFIRAHTDLLAATDFFTTEVWTKAGLVTYYVLFSTSPHGASMSPA